MNLEKFREYCLSLGDVSEKMPFGKFAAKFDSILAFYVLGHMFCFIDIDNFTFVDLRSTEDEIARMRDTYDSVGDPLNQSKKYWIRLRFDGDIPDAEIYESIRSAFETVKNKHTPKRK